MFEEPPQLTEVKKLEMDVSCFVLNDEDRLRLKDLRVVKLPSFSVDVQQRISYSLVDLLFAFLFDLRINEWETNSLTGLMIGKLAPSLSGMVQYSSAKEALCVAVRRSLCYSLYRQFELGKLVAEDTKKLIGEGRYSFNSASTVPLQYRPLDYPPLLAGDAQTFQHFGSRIYLLVQSAPSRSNDCLDPVG